MQTDDKTRYPLAWPTGWPRSATRAPARFRCASLAIATKDLLRELTRLDVDLEGVVISTNVELKRNGLPYSGQRNPDDPGVAVYFTRKNKPIAMACDRWNRVEDNLRAIAKHIDSLRGQDRWGVGSLDRAFTAYDALPNPESETIDWRTELELPSTATVLTRAQIVEAFRALLIRRHPDTGGSNEALVRLKRARDAALVAIGETP